MKYLAIRRLRAAQVVARSPKPIGKNSRLEDHGDTYHEWIVRVETAGGLEGIGRVRGGLKQLEQEAPGVLGHDARQFFKKERVTLNALEFAIWDLMGKALGKPVWKMLEPRAAPPVADAYDGSLYFADLIFTERPLDRMQEEAAAAVARGFRAIKMKVGRGHRWMPPADGRQRDLDCIRAVREAVGPAVRLMVDGNNGFDCGRATRLFAEAARYDLYWAEEMFPEEVADYEDFKSYLRGINCRALIADGETQPGITPMRACHEAGLIDVNQLDINRIGLNEWARLCHAVLPSFPVSHPSRNVAPAHYRTVLASPHTWGSPFGLWVSLNLCVFPSFLTAEVPAYEHDALIPVGYEWRGGKYHLNDAPGLGIEIDEAVWNRDYLSTERVFE